MDTKYSPLVIHKDSPFKQRIEKNIVQTRDEATGVILNETVTITRERQYLNMPWLKIYQDKDKLGDLSPWACKILIHMSMKLSWNQERIKISRLELRATKAMFRKAMLELLSKEIVANTGVREWYWVNVGIIIMGSINKHEGN